MRPHRLASKLTAAIVGTACIALAALGIASARSTVRATKTTARTGLTEVSSALAGRISETFSSYLRISDALKESLTRPYLSTFDRKKVLLAHSIRFPEIKRAALLDSAGKVEVSTDPSFDPASTLRNTALVEVPESESRISGVYFGTSGLPFLILAGRTVDAGDLVIELDITRIWRLVEGLRVGATGHVVLLDPYSRLLAHGSPQGKKLVIRQPDQTKPLNIQWPFRGTVAEYRGVGGAQVVGAASAVEQLGWTVIVEQDQAEAYAASRPALLLLSMFLVFLVLGTVLVGFRTSRVLSKPLEDLVAATRSVSKGELNVQVSEQGDDERAELARSFNEMIRELSKLHGEIARQERLSTIGRLAGELIHDLKHPVRNLENAARLLTERADDPEVRAMFERVTHREFGGLKRFLSGLEDLTSNAPAQSIRLDITSEVGTILESFRNAIEFQGVQWAMSAEHPVLWSRADPFLVRRVLENIFKNAAEATPKGGRVDISVTETGPWTQITVLDEGPGIKPEMLPTLFDDLRTTKRRGMGLGLATARRLVTQMKGEIRADNSIEGKGAVFTVLLPRDAAEAQSREYETRATNSRPGPGKGAWPPS